MKKKNKCIFFDRDNTLIYDKGYTYKKKDLKWKPYAKKIIKFAIDLDYLVIVITNQSGVARGFYNEKQVKEFHFHMNTELKKMNTYINDFFYCPFHIDGIGKYKKNSNDRKPNNGMLIKAIKKWDIDIQYSYFVGDKLSDYHAAKKTKIKYINGKKLDHFFNKLKKLKLLKINQE